MPGREVSLTRSSWLQGVCPRVVLTAETLQCLGNAASADFPQHCTAHYDRDSNIIRLAAIKGGSVPLLGGAAAVQGSGAAPADLTLAFAEGCSSAEPLSLLQIMPIELCLGSPRGPRGHVPLHARVALPRAPLCLTPLRLLRLFDTPLARHIQGHADQQQMGYLTMDQTRRLVALQAGFPREVAGWLYFTHTLQSQRQASEPRLFSTPLVGVWLTGVARATDALVYAACVKFMAHRHLKDRALATGTSFLVYLLPTIGAWDARPLALDPAG